MSMSEEQRKQVANAVREFHERAREAETILVAFDAIIELSPESPLINAVLDLIEGYADALGQAYGIREWLLWWRADCKLGKNPLQARLGDGLREISDIDDLIGIVLDDLARAEVIPS